MAQGTETSQVDDTENQVNTIDLILSYVRRVHESQERTEAMVKAFIENMEKNPMMAMMAKLMPGGKNGR